MDQATFATVCDEFRQQCGTAAALPDLAVTAGHPDAPIVVLVHGIGGNARHWADPLSLNPADTWLFDLNARPQGGQGLGSSPPYQPGWGCLSYGSSAISVQLALGDQAARRKRRLSVSRPQRP